MMNAHRSEIRVVSLVPSASETLRAWGIDPIAVTRFCEQPDLATVGGTKNPDLARIVALAPDLVVMDEEENRREDHAALTAAGLEVHVLHVRSLADVGPQMAALAERVGAVWTPLPTAAPASGRLRAFVPIWRRPWMALGTPTYGADLLHLLGVEVMPSDQGPYVTLELDAVRAASPDIILAPTEPYSFKDEHLDELVDIAPTTVIDGQDLFWWGARTTGAIDRLRRALATVTGGDG